MAISNTSPNTDNYFIGKGVVYWMGDGETTWRDLGNVPEFEVSLTLDKLDHFSSREGTRKKDRSIIREQGGTVRMVIEELTARNLELALMSTATVAVDLDTTGDITTGEPDITGLASTTNLVDGRQYSVSGTGIPVGALATWDATNAKLIMDQDATATTPDLAINVSAPISMDIFSEAEKKGRIKFVGTNQVGAKCTYMLNNVSLTPTSSFNPISDEWGNFEVTGELLTDAFGKFGQIYYDTAGEASA